MENIKPIRLLIPLIVAIMLAVRSLQTQPCAEFGLALFLTICSVSYECKDLSLAQPKPAQVRSKDVSMTAEQ